jgi:hypothetical protein
MTRTRHRASENRHMTMTSREAECYGKWPIFPPYAHSLRQRNDSSGSEFSFRLKQAIKLLIFRKHKCKNMVAPLAIE